MYWLGARDFSPTCKKQNADPMGDQVLCYGDSNTYGYDPRSCLGERYPENVQWTALLRAQGLDIFNAGQNGRSIPQSGWEMDSLVQIIRRQQPEILTVMLGTNDLLQCPGLSAEVCAARMEKFLTAFLAKTQTDLKTLLVAPPPMSQGTWVNDPRALEESHRLAGCYKAAAHRLGIHFADAGVWGVGLTYDGVHFSEQGHLAFAKGMRKVLDALL